MNKRKAYLLLLFSGLLFVTSGAFWVFNAFKPAPEESDNLFEIRKNAEIFYDVYKHVDALYVEEPSPGKLMKKGIDAMLQELDPFTVYIPESKIEDYRFMTTGQYGGIGALIRQDGDYVMITEPYEGFPAQKAGLMAGDVIIEVDGKSIKGKNSSQVSNILKGESGSEVKVTVKRGEKEITEALIREEVKIPDVPYSGMIEDEIGYIKLTSFTRTAHVNVEKAFVKLQAEGMKKLVLDLRGNGGGLLIEAVKIVNIFVPKGKTVVEMKSRLEDKNKVYTTQSEPLDTVIPIAVLVDGSSASASEIVSGAIQDLDRGVVIGRQTYGKGLVQQTRDVKYGGMVKITIAKYYTPSGRCIQKIDYSHRQKDGSVAEVPDSLIRRYKTRAGREVTDGRGIEPDVKVELPKMSPLTGILVRDDIIFDFATSFRQENKEIAAADEFNIDDILYNDFVEYALTHEFDYTTVTKKRLEDWKKIAQEEKYFDEAEEEFEALLEEVEPDKTEDIQKFKPEITPILENEIVGRYYYQFGRFLASVDTDHDVVKAREILNDEERYKNILR